MEQSELFRFDVRNAAQEKTAQAVFAVCPVAATETFGAYSRALASPTRLADLTGDYVAAIAIDYADWEQFSLRAASVAGGHHRLHRTVRQDSFAVAELAGGVVIVVVGDGVGCYPNSHIAAAWACNAACALLSDEMTRQPDLTALEPEGILTKVNDGLFALQKAMAVDFATTLVISVVTCAQADHLEVWLARVGDSTAATLSQMPEGDPIWQFLFDEQADAAGGIATTETRALPDQQLTYEQKLIQLPRGIALFLLTDGISTPLALSESVRDGLGRRWLAPPGPLDFASQVSFNRRGEHDDRTVVGVWAR